MEEIATGRDSGLTRRKFMTVAGAASAAGAATPWIARTADVTDTGGSPGDHSQFADAVLAAFDRHRVVAIGESHDHQEHHDALQIMLADPRLPEVVDDIVVEFGNALYQPVMDQFVAGGAVENPDLRPVWRNTTQSPQGEPPVYEQFYRMVRAANWTLPPHKKIRVLLGDPPIDWSQITTQDQVLAFVSQRDTHMADLVEQEVLNKGRRALVSYGSTHVLHALPGAPPPPPGDDNYGVPQIEQQTGEHVYVIVAASHPRLAPHPRRTVIACKGTWLESADPSQFSYFPHACSGQLGSLADALLYLGQPEDQTRSCWNPAIYLDPAWWAELQRRNAIMGNPIDLESLRQEQPISFPAPPPSCP